MLSSTDHDKLQQIIQEHPETEELFNRIFKSHQMDISTISHEIRNPLTLVYSTLQLIESQHPEVLEFAHWSELHQDIEYMKLLLEDLSSYNNGERLDLAPLSTGSPAVFLSGASELVDMVHRRAPHPGTVWERRENEKPNERPTEWRKLPGSRFKPCSI